MEDLAIKVDGVSKDFVLPHERTTTLKGALTHLFSKKGKEDQHALKDISIEIKKGEFFGIVGRNGSGKSTLLKILAGIYQPTTGSVQVSGRLVPFIELGVGFNPELSGRDNVYLNGAMLGFSVKEINNMYDDIVSFAELERFMDQKLKNYSSGMQVRLAFSLAIRAEADILLIDEVLAVGDEDFQRKCFNYFKTLKKDEKTVVFVSHDMGAIREYCDRAMLINDSRIQAIGKTFNIANQYSELFINNVFKKAHKTGTALTRWGTGDVKIEKVKLSKSVLNDDDQLLKIDVVLEAVHKHDHLMTGVRIKNATGQIVTESNTWMENRKMPALKPGDSCNVSWVIPNLYSDGTYSVDIYAQGDVNLVFDAWDEAVMFQEKRPDTKGSIVRVNPELTVSTMTGNKRS